MEKINYLPNGQWKLEKMAWGTPMYDKVGDKGHDFTPSEHKGHQASVVNHIKNEGYKTKEVDGKLHVLGHRGISNNIEDGDHIDPSAKGNNMLNFKDGKHVSNDGNVVVSLHQGEADSYAHGQDGDKGMSHSFWIPIDSVIGHGASLDATGDAEEDWVDAVGDHMLVSPGKYKIHETRHFKPADGNKTFGGEIQEPHKIDSPHKKP